MNCANCGAPTRTWADTAKQKCGRCGAGLASRSGSIVSDEPATGTKTEGWPVQPVLDDFWQFAARDAATWSTICNSEVTLLDWQAASDPRYIELRVAIAGDEVRFPILIYSLNRFYENREQLLQTNEDNFTVVQGLVGKLDKMLIKFFQVPLVEELQRRGLYVNPYDRQVNGPTSAAADQPAAGG